MAALGHDELVALALTTFPFQALAARVWAARVWALHPTVSAYDVAYVTLSEALDVPLVTLDYRLARADGPTCEFLLPPA